MDQSAIPSRHAQRGAVLLVSVVLLFILTFLGLVAMKIATLEEKMSGAAMDKNVAFQAAESALRDGEQDVLNNLTSSSGFSAACMTGLCLPSTTAVAICDSISWTGGLPRNYGSYTGAAAIPDVLTQPKYIVELLPDLPAGAGNSLSSTLRSSSTGGGTAFRITAVGWGKQSGTQVMLQSIYVKQ